MKAVICIIALLTLATSGASSANGAVNSSTNPVAETSSQSFDLQKIAEVRLLMSVKQQTEAAVARGETLEQTRKSVNLDEFRKAVAGDSKFKRFIFDAYVTDPAVAAAFNHLSKK